MVSIISNSDGSEQLFFTSILIFLVWLLTILLEGMTLVFGAFVPNHARGLNALGLCLLVFFPLCGVIGTIALIKH